MDRSRAGLEDAYTGSLLSCPYTSTQVSDVGAIMVKVQGPTFHSDGDGSATNANVPRTAPPRPSRTLKRVSQVCIKKACRYFVHHSFGFLRFVVGYR